MRSERDNFLMAEIHSGLQLNLRVCLTPRRTAQFAGEEIGRFSGSP